MKKLFGLFLVLTFLLVSCEPVDSSTVTYPQPVTQIPFYSTDTPVPFIIPVTETPVFIQPVTETAQVEVLPPTTEIVVPPPATEIIPLPNRWWDVYFTDPLTINNPDAIAGSIEEKLIALIDSAQTSIHIASFEFNLTPVANALIAAKNRGVDVKWVTDDENGTGYDTQPGRGQFALMSSAGIEVKDDGGRNALMHNKFWIFDQNLVWTGSTNITVNGIFKQNNNVLVIRSTDIAYIYEKEFQELWSGQFGPRAPSNVSNQWAILDGTPVQVCFQQRTKLLET
ncbi:MAG: phospholipase D-like domain-containing protein [Anaerolineales bacterium]